MLGYQTTRADILQFVQPREHQQSQLVGTRQYINHQASPHNKLAVNPKGGQRDKCLQENPPVSAEELREELDWQFLETEYLDDYGSILIALEKQTQPLALHMDAQPEITWEMRPILLDFIIQAHLQFHLKPETLFLTINLMDRYLSKRIVYKKHYQLLGMCSLWIAAKYEDVKDNVPTCSDLWYMCMKCYDDVDFKHMEGHVLRTLGYELGFPTQEIWVKYLLATECVNRQGDEGDQKVEFWEDCDERKKMRDVARFAMEAATFHRSFIWCPASVISKGAIYLARHILGKKQIKPLLDHEVLQCVQSLDQILPTASQILRDKYSHQNLSHASQLVQDYIASVSIRPSLPWILSQTSDLTAHGHNPRQLWIQPGLCNTWREDQNDYHGQHAQFAQFQQHASQLPNMQHMNESCRGAITPQPVCAPPTPVTPTMMVEPIDTLPERKPAQQTPFYRATSQKPMHTVAALDNNMHTVAAQDNNPNNFVAEHNYKRGGCDVYHHSLPFHKSGCGGKPNNLQIHIPHPNVNLPHLYHASQELPSPATSTLSLPSPSLSSLSISSASTSCTSSTSRYTATNYILDSNPSNHNSCVRPPTLPNHTPESTGIRQVLTEYYARWVDGGYPMMMVD